MGMLTVIANSKMDDPDDHSHIILTKDTLEKKDKKKNPIIGYGKSGSIIVKVHHKKNKHEVALKEISKKGKSID